MAHHRGRGHQDPSAGGRLRGTAGEQYDPCDHEACDTFDNNSDEVLDLNSDAVAFATLQYAMSTESVNGVPGKGNFTPAAAVGGRMASQLAVA